jgi:ornithine cyclodeaminase/alanine dehydrogenase-like protein (mu-crystallin family)
MAELPAAYGKCDVGVQYVLVAIGQRAVGRESDSEIILYISLGIWGEYAAILPQVYRRAKELGLGTVLGNHA